MAALALEVRDLHKTFDTGFLGAVPGFGGLAKRLQIKGVARQVRAVRGISLSVEAGQIYGFLGPNGAGKTTTIKMLAGLIRPTQGEGSVLGWPLGHRQARARLGFLPEHPYFYEYLKPLEFLDFYGALFNINRRERRRRAERLLDRVGLSDALDRPIRKFSKGMVQRIGVAQALMNDPDLVILDEPMSGLDPVGRKDVRDLIFELKEQGKTVFFSSHILQDVEMICDRVALLIAGELHAEGRLETLLQEPAQTVEVAVRGIDDALAERLDALAGRAHTIHDRRVYTLSSAAHESLQAMIDTLHAGGGELVSVVPHRRSLEDLFVAHVGEI